MFKLKREPKEKKAKEPKLKEPKQKKIRKRFSVLEIVSVVTLLVIAGTVGIIVYKNHFKKEVPQTDKELINQLNQSVSKNFKKKKQLDLTEVLDNLENDGIVFSKLKFSSPTDQLIFDDVNNQFCIYEPGTGVTYPDDLIRKEEKIDTSLWKFTSKNPNDKASKFSYYLLNECEGDITVVGGVDVGKNEDIYNITYMNLSKVQQKVTIRTNSFETNLAVSETTGDSINHYGRLGKLTVYRLNTDSYHEYGDLKYAYIPVGRVVIESSGSIDVAYVTGEAAFIQNNGGTIKDAYASTYRVQRASEKKDDKYGNKVALKYNDDLSQEVNESNAISAGEGVVTEAIIAERIERGYEKHPNAIGYCNEDNVITVFDSLKEIAEFFKDGRECTVYITGNTSFSETVVFKDTNLEFVGRNGNWMINGNIQFINTSGYHTNIFKYLSFSFSDSSKDGILDNSTCKDENDINKLEFKNCNFSYNGAKTNKASIALSPDENGKIGTYLTVENCDFSYRDNNPVAITTHALYESGDSVNINSQITSLKKHTIIENNFSCTNTGNNPAIITNYANITKNKFSNFDIAFNFIPTLIGTDSFQFDVSVASNNISLSRFLFYLVNADQCYRIDKDKFKFNFYDASSNIFSKVENIGFFDVATTHEYIESAINTWPKNWNGVKNAAIGVTLDNITMNLEEAPFLDYFTLSTGERITTYTQLEFDEENPRTGYTIKDVDGNLYYYFGSFNNEMNIFLKEDTNEAYVTLLSNKDVRSLQIKESETEIDWFDETIFEDEELYNSLKYFDYESEEKIGAIFKLDDLYRSIDGNTYKNCQFTESDISDDKMFLKTKKLDVVIPEDPEEEVTPAKPVELFISDIGKYDSLVLTNSSDATVEDGQMVISVETDTNVVLSGDFNVEVDGVLNNLELKGSLNVSLTDSSYVENVTIYGERAIDTTLTNLGEINKLVVNSRATINNYSNAVISNLIVGEVGDRYIEETLERSSGTRINNDEGEIRNLTAYSNVTISNEQISFINNLTISCVEGYESKNISSSITNYGSMCYDDGSIYLFTTCTFDNRGVIGTEDPVNGWHGAIIIGNYGNNDAFSGVTFKNKTGTIFAGHIFNEETEEYDVRTFIVYGFDGSKKQKVTIESNVKIGDIDENLTNEEILYIVSPEFIEMHANLVEFTI